MCAVVLTVLVGRFVRRSNLIYTASCALTASCRVASHWHEEASTSPQFPLARHCLLTSPAEIRATGSCSHYPRMRQVSRNQLHTQLVLIAILKLWTEKVVYFQSPLCKKCEWGTEISVIRKVGCLGSYKAIGCFLVLTCCVGNSMADNGKKNYVDASCVQLVS